MADGLDLSSGSSGEKKPNYLMYGVILILLVGGFFLIERMKSGGSSSSGASVGGTAVGSSPPVNANTTEYIYNIKNVGNTTKNSNNSTTTTAPTNTSAAGGSSSGTVPVSTAPTNTSAAGGSSSGTVPVSTSSTASSYNSGGSGGGFSAEPIGPVFIPTVTFPSHNNSVIGGYTNTGVPILATESSYSNAESQAKLAQLASSQATSIPGVSSSLVGYDKSLAKSNQISGVTNTNVIILNKSDSFAQTQSILDSAQGVSIPGLSASEVGYLQNKARHGQLTPQLYQSAIGG